MKVMSRPRSPRSPPGASPPCGARSPSRLPSASFAPPRDNFAFAQPQPRSDLALGERLAPPDRAHLPDRLQAESTQIELAHLLRAAQGRLPATVARFPEVQVVATGVV